MSSYLIYRKIKNRFLTVAMLYRGHKCSAPTYGRLSRNLMRVPTVLIEGEGGSFLALRTGPDNRPRRHMRRSALSD